MENKNVRTVIVGGGMAAEVHHQAMERIIDIDVVGLYDNDSDVANHRAREWGVRTYESFQSVLSDDDVNAVHILTPTETHAALCLEAMAAGKHVFVEKPVGTTEEIQALLEAARTYGVLCMPGHNYAYQPEFARVRSLIRNPDSGFGTPRAAWITYCIQHPEDVARSYSGVLEEVMVHHSYLALALFGAPDKLLAGKDPTGWQSLEVEDQAWMTWRYRSGLSVHMFASFAVDDPTTSSSMFTVKVLGTSGAASYNWADCVVTRPIGSLAFGIPAYEATYEATNQAFVRAINEGPEHIVSSLDDAFLAAHLGDLAQQSSTSIQGIDVLDQLPRRG